MARLGDVGLVITGNTPKTSEAQNYESNDICFVKPSDIIDGTVTYLDKSEFYISEHARAKARILPPKSVLVTCIGIIGKVAINNVECAFNQQINAIIPDDSKCLTEYLAYAIQNKQPEMQDVANAPVVPILNKTQFSDIEINLPSLTEQEEMVEKLNAVSWLIALRIEQLAKLDQLVKSRFVELFGEVETNVKGFSMKRMDECCKFIGGAQPDKSHFEYEKTDDNIRLIQIRDYKSDRFITYIPKSLARKTCTASDIMIGRYGPPIFQILGGIEGAYNVALMKAVPTAEFNTEYFRYFLKSEKLLHYLESFSQRTAGQDGIQIDKLNAYPCFVPPMELQIQFAAFVEQTDKSKLAIQQSLDKLETLKKSLMQEYFG